MAKWQSELLTDQEVRQEWSGTPWNVGILTGTPSGFWVLDIDPENGGSEEMERLSIENGGISPSYVVQTGSGGVHYYFSMPDFPITNSKGRLPRGIDVRADGGQVVAPPSRSGKGNYSTIAESPLLLPAPDWLLDLIRPVERAAPTVSSGMTLGEMKPVVLGGIRRELARLDAMKAAATPDGRGYAGEPWDATCFEIACNLLELCNEGGGGHDWAHWEFVSRAPRDAGFTSERIEAKWTSAERKIGDKARGWAGTSVLGFGAPTMANVVQMYPRMGSLPPAMTPATNTTGEPERIDMPGSQGVGSPGDDGWSSEALAGGEQPAGPTVEDLVAALDAEILTARQLDEIPPPEPLISGFLVRDSIARLNGPSGHGKSFVALDMAICVSLGRPWHGHDVHHGDVVYLVAEGGRGVRQRVRAWEQHFGQLVEGIGFLPRPVQAASAEWELLIEVCRRRKPALIVVDTQARVTVGVEENSAKEMGVVVHQLEALRAATEACVLLIHHEGKGDRGGRGSSAVKGAMQTELTVNKDGPIVTIMTDKQKDDAELDDLELQVRTVQLGESDEGRPVSSLVLVTSEVGWSHEELAANIDPASLVDISTREQLESISSTTFHRGNGGTKAEHRTVLNDARKQAGQPPLHPASFHRAWNELIESGAIAQIAGTASWKWLPPAKRAGLQRLDKGKGFYAPSDDDEADQEAGPGVEGHRRRLRKQRARDKASGVDMDEVIE
jgi:hypothetical protein